MRSNGVKYTHWQNMYRAGMLARRGAKKNESTGDKDIDSALARRQNVHDDHLQSLVQVLSKVDRLEFTHEDVVGSRDEAHIH